MANIAFAAAGREISKTSFDQNVSLAEILSAFSFALDLTVGAMPGHALRGCVLGMRLAQKLGTSPRQLASLYYALLMKDVGGGSKPGRDRGAQILRKLGLGEVAAEAVRGLDEHWDGSGYPEGRKGEAIPVESRILAVAQHLDVFATEDGVEKALTKLRGLGGSWFAPELVQIADGLHREGELWEAALYGTPESETRKAAMQLAPDLVHNLDAADIDLICEAFADVVDAKSSFTCHHSLGVAEAAMIIALELGLSEERMQLVKRAALLHDIGKLHVPNSILDKPSKLDAEEWRIVQEHPRLTREILSRVRAFGELAMIAGAHHEKLDGTGYPDRLTADQLPLEARILAVADVYGALTEDRPYRAGLSLDEVVGIMCKDIPHKLDADCFEALMSAVSFRA